MKSYHYFFYMLKIIILTLIVLIHFDVIYVNNKYYHLIETIFKTALGFFIIIFFSVHNFGIDKHDKILIILSGFILILISNYSELIKEFRVSES